METFNFPYHGNPEMTPEENNSSIILKDGFRFDPEPSEPIIRVFSLNFPVMAYRVLPDGAPDVQGTLVPEFNIMSLWQFYVRHGTWKTFTYPHPVFGNVTVKFNAPFTLPAVEGNLGMVKNTQVTLREHPA